MTFNSEFEKLGNMFLAAVRYEAGVSTVQLGDELIELPQFNASMTDIENPLSIDLITLALQRVRERAPETVRALEPEFARLIAEAESGQGIDDDVIQGYITSGSTAITSIFSGITALVAANNTSTTNSNTTNVSNASSSTTNTKTSDTSLNLSIMVGGLAIVGILAFALLKK